MHTINVEGISVYAFHGCLNEEAKIGGNYIVDVSMNIDFTEAASSDDLTKTIDYIDVYHIVKEEMAIRSKLIEHVGKRILDRLNKKFPQLIHCKVKVTKINPPMNGNVEKVSVILEF
jgi:dihydroneopterin aldolase